MLGSTIWHYIQNPEALKGLQDSFSILTQSRICPEVVVVSLLSPNGKQMNAELHWSYHFQNDHQLSYVATIVDVTSQMRSQRLLNKLSLVVEHAKELIMITDHKGVIEYVNPAFSAVSGYSSDEVIGSNPSILKSNAQDDSYYKEMWNTISAGDVWSGSMIDRRKDGSFYPVEGTITPILDRPGKISSFVSIQQDMTEKQEIQEQFIQAQKMEAIGTLVGGISHDFNNLLNGITGNSYLARIKSEEDIRILQHLDDIEMLTQRASETIRHLLTFARKGTVDMEDFALKSFLEEAYRLISIVADKQVNINFHLPEQDLLMHGNSTQLQQALLNLVNNACHAVKESSSSPEISVTLSPFKAEPWFKEKYKLESDHFARLSVKDNGYGIAVDKIEKIFKPFFTTKGVGTGTGLGLAMVASTVDAHHGALQVESELGRGSTFNIYLPAEEIVPIEQNENTMQPQCDAGCGVLLVDDQEFTLKSTSEALRMLGYRVLEAKNGKDAVELFSAHQNIIDIVVTDIQMPVKNGIDEAREIRAFNGDVPIVFITSQDRSEALSQIGEFDHHDLLNKPICPDKLSVKIQRLLGR